MIPRLFFVATALLLLFVQVHADSRYMRPGRQTIDGQCYYCGKSNSDPHIHTYDGKEYQCQGAGDYVLTKSKSSNFEAQARFWVPGADTSLTGGRNGATTTAAVLSTGVGVEKPIEMHVIPEGMAPIPSSPTGRLPSSVNDCEMEYWINGQMKEFPTTTGSSEVQGGHTYTDTANGYTFDRYRQMVHIMGWGFTYHHWRHFEMLDSGVIYKSQKQFDSTFGCYLDVYVCLPCDFGEEFHGLFGNPNGDIGDDFETRSGQPITEAIPTLGQETTYCATNWCVEDTDTSLFTTGPKYERCVSDESVDLDDLVENADPTIKSQCGDNTNCILDAVITGNIETGLRNLEDGGNSKDEEVLEKVEENEVSDSYTCAKAGMEATKAFAASSDHFPHPVNVGDLPHDQLNTCFLDNGFAQLGWSFLVSADGHPWEFPMYAGGTSCTDMGEIVGKLTVTYQASTQVCQGTYESLNGYTLQEFQFFCGTTTFPTLPNSNTPTVATTLYGCSHLETTSHTTDSCDVTTAKRTDRGGGIGNSQWVSVIAHAISCSMGPTESPTQSPTKAPTTDSPTTSPTGSPTTSPTGSPTTSPTDSPTTDSPTESPTKAPTTDAPTESPTKAPTTDSPTESPTKAPTTSSPTESPTDSPTESPTKAPTTDSPTESPTKAPTTDSPTASPTKMPSDAPETEDRNFRAPPKDTIAPTPPPSKGSGSGDPHFKTWTGQKFDYHGECDLVLVDNPSFMDGLGLRVHIRTTTVKHFSFIEKVALQIGTDVLEFDNDVEHFLINGKPVGKNQKHHKTRLGGFVVRRDLRALSVRLADNGSANSHHHKGAKIDLHTRKNGFPAVIVDGGNTNSFQGSLGLLGEWSTGRTLARDGVTEIPVEQHNATEFALMWQVRDTDPMLFAEARFPQFPTTCTPPAKMTNRLGQSSFQLEAKEACAHWTEDKDDCIFDVIATRDVLVAQEGHIVHVE